MKPFLIGMAAGSFLVGLSGLIMNDMERAKVCVVFVILVVVVLYFLELKEIKQ